MATSINTLKNWFKTGLKPPQAQWWAWLDSYRHKDEPVPAAEVSGLQGLLDGKQDKTATVPAGQSGPYVPSKVYVFDALSAEYASYINTESPNPFFTIERFYRLRENAPAGESPETHPAHWVHQGTVLGNINIGDVARLVEELGNRLVAVISLDDMRTLDAEQRDRLRHVFVLDQMAVYTYYLEDVADDDYTYIRPFNHTGPGTYYRVYNVNSSNLVGVYYTPDAAHLADIGTTMRVGQAAIFMAAMAPVVHGYAAPVEVTVTGPGMLYRTGAGSVAGDFVFVGFGEGTGITPEQAAVIAAAQTHMDGADTAKHSTNQIIEQAAHALLSLPENSKLNAVIAAITTFLQGTINTNAINDASWQISESRLAMLQKLADGSINIQGSALLVNIFAPPGVDTQLTDRSGWTNEGKTITGANTNGELGKPGQLRILADATVCYCQSAIAGASGSATYKRNRAHDVMDETNAQDFAVINELKLETGWNTVTQVKVITIPARMGTYYKDPAGYRYDVFAVSGTSSYCMRMGTAAAWPTDINASSHPTLTTRLLAHDFSISDYSPQSGDEPTRQGQFFCDASTRKVFRKNFTNKWERIDRYGN